MNPIDRTEVVLSVAANSSFLPLVTSFVEKSALAFGMDEEQALALTLAVEEIFAYLCAQAAAGKEIRIRSFSGGYFSQTDFMFHARDFDIKAFNLTAAPSFRDDKVTEETGLLIASRMVDHFHFTAHGDLLQLSLVKEKAYPPATHTEYPVVPPMPTYKVRKPETEELKEFVRQVCARYDRRLVPESFFFPGKVVDMVAVGDYSAAIAVDDSDIIGGGIVWRSETEKMVEFYGPHLFNQPGESQMAEALVDSCIYDIAKSGAIGLINRRQTPELPVRYFELLGELSFRDKNGCDLDLRAYYRHLKEDLGSVVWAHESVRDFLSERYDLLDFARSIRIAVNEGETGSLYSTLSAEFDKASDLVTLRPIWLGSDLDATVAAHVEALRRENIALILFEMDLGRPWHCHFTPALLNNGFEPRLVLPYSGKGDLLVFQCKAL